MYAKLQSQEFMRDPSVLLAQMRGEGALVRSKIPILGKVWFTTTQAASAEILKNGDRFSVQKPNGKAIGLSWWTPRLLNRLTANMLSSDEPEHKRLRTVVDHAFQRRAVMGMSTQIDALAPQKAVELKSAGETFDLIENFARPFPLSVICDLLGLPEEDHEAFSKWAASITSVNGVFSFFLAIRRLRPLMRYIENRITHERERGGTGLIHQLVNESEDALSEDELVAMVFLLLLAGHETTTHLISGGVLALLENPDELEKLRKDPSLIDLTVEELLRFVSPVQTTKPRYVREDCEVSGVPLKRGDLVMPLLVASNFDPALFDEAEKLKLDRRPNRHIEFGAGIHFCLGHQLARFEMKAAIETLLLSEKPIELAVASDTLSWRERFGLRALKELPVRFQV